MSSSGTLCSPASPHVVDQLGFTIRRDVETMRLNPQPTPGYFVQWHPNTHTPPSSKTTVAFPVLDIDPDRKRSRLHSGHRSLEVLFAPLGGFDLPASDTHHGFCQPFVLGTPCLQSPSSAACTKHIRNLTGGRPCSRNRGRVPSSNQCKPTAPSGRGCKS